ncbi:hypothetical protein [Neisseria sp. 74A18]|nr:hypothetical protein [Neisseria sp. 74A18]
MIKRLNDIPADSQKHKHDGAKVVGMVLQDNEATKRLVMHSAKRVISAH